MATLQERLDAYKKASGKSGDTRSLAERVQSYKTAGRDNIVSRLNKWFTNNDIFVSNYQKRTAGTTGSYDDKFDSGASSWLETVTNQKNNFDIEARAIKSYLETNRDEFDSEWLDNALKSLSAAQKNQESILAGTKSFNDYWSQWDTEESYNKWAAGMKDREAKLNYDLRAGKAEISRLETISGNASALSKRITELENTLEARRKYAMRMGTTALIDSSKKEAELSALKAEYDSKYKNFDLDELAAEINDKKSYYTLAERMQSAEALKNDAMSATDFESYAQKGAAVKNPTYAEANGSDNFLGWKNPFAKGEEIQNIVTYARDNDAALQMAGAGAANSGDIAEIEGIRLYNLMTDDEVKVYNYYIGKGDRASADAYLESLTDTLNQRKAGEMYKGIEGNTALEMVFGVAAGLDQFTQGVANLFNGDDYIPTSSNQYLSGMIREDLADNGPNVLGSSLSQIGYDLITTGSNMLPSILIGGGFGAALLGASAGGNAKAEMLRMGYSKDQATAYGVLVGASESLLEYAFSGISRIGGKAWQTLGKSGIASKVDNILGNISVKAPGIVIALGKTLGGAAGEAFEEGLQSILEPWFKSFVVGGDIEAPDWEEVAYSSLLGALSGGFFEGIGSSATVSSVSGVGRNIKKTQSVSKLLELGQTYSADSVAYKLAGKINDVVKSGGKVNAYSIGQLYMEEGAMLTEQNVSDLARGLEELGWDSKSASVTAKAYAQFLEGTIEATEDVKMLLSENQPLTQALIKKLIGENTTAYQRTKGYVDLGRMSSKSESDQAVVKPKLSEEERAAYEAADKMIRADQKKLGFEASRDIARGMVVNTEAAPQRDAVDRVYKALNVKGEYSYSEGDGVTLKSSGEAAEVVDVVSTKDGEMKVKLSDGKTVDAKELDFRSEGEALVYETVANLGVDPASAWSIIKNYDPNGEQRGDEYALGAVEAFKYGKIGEKNISSSGFAAKLTESQRKLAYDLGRFSAKNESEARQKRISEIISKIANKKKASGSLTYDKSVDVSSLREDQKVQIGVLGKVAEGLGVKVRLFESGVDENGKSKFTLEDGTVISDNGWYDPETGEIWVDVNAGDSRNGLILITSAHELTHFIKDWSPAKYKEFADFLVKTYGESGKSVDEIVRDHTEKSRHDLTYDEAFDEVVARSCESFLMDRDVEMRIVELTQRDKTLAQKIKTFIGQLLAKLKKIAEDLGLKPDSEEGRLVSGMTDSLRQLHDLWVDALADAGKSYSKAGVSGGERKAQYSERYEEYDKPISLRDIEVLRSIGRKSINEFTSEEIEKAQKWAYKFYKELGVKSPFFRAWFGDWRAYDKRQIKIVSVPTIDISQTSLVNGNYFVKDTGWNVYAGKTLNDDTRHHSGGNRINVKALNAIEAVLDNAVLLDTIVSEKDTKKKSENTAFLHKLYTIIQYNNRKYIAKTTVEEYYNETINDISRRAYNLKAIKIEPVGGQIGDNSSSSIPDTSSMISISDLYEIVKSFDKDFSSSPKVNEKMLYEDGTPKVFYHGTKESFTVFDKKKAKSSGLYGKGFYFTDSKSHSASYGDAMAVYLNIRKPLSPDSDTVTKSQIRDFLSAVAENEDYSIENYGTYDVEKILAKITSRDAFSVIQDINATAIGNFVEAVELFNSVNGTKYDGIVVPTETVAFYPEQIKSATDNIGTFDSKNPDIRYSERNLDAVTNREVLATALESAAQNDIERKRLAKYKAEVAKYDALGEELRQVRAEIKEISFSKGKRDTERLRGLKDRATELANNINTYDKRLLRLEAAAPLRNVIKREVKSARYAETVSARQKIADARLAGRMAQDKIDAEVIRKKDAQIKALREQRDREVAEEKAKSRERIGDMRASGIRAKIKKIRADIESTLLHPTDGKYIPVPLGRAMIEVCDLIDIDTPLVKKDGTPNAAQEKRERTKARLSELAAEYENLKHNEDQMLVSEHDEQIDAYLKDLRNRYDDVSLNEMSYEELKYFHDVLKSIMGTLRDARKVIGKNDARTLYEYGDAIIEEQKKIKAERGERGDFKKLTDKTLNLSLSPIRNVERMSGYNEKSALVEITRDFEEGVRRKNLFEMRAKKTFEELTTGENEKNYHDAIYKELGGKIYTDSDGKKFGISKMQMMQAILSYEREQANPSHNHIANGGFTFADLGLLNKGELGAAVSEEDAHSIFGGYALVSEFINKLARDEWAQAYMKASREFFNGMAKDAINDTYLTLKHRILARDKSYIPYEVDKSYVVREITGIDSLQQTINSYGMLQETVKNASQPLIITGLNNMLDRHIDQVGSVYGLAIPIRNFNKIWNISEKRAEGDTEPKKLVKAAIEQNWGEDGRKSIEQMVMDLQGSRHHERTKLERAIESGYIGSTFALNLSVVTKQIGSLYTANSMLDTQRTSAAMLTNLLNTMIHFKQLSAEVDKYTAAVYNRREGLSNQEIYTLATQAKKSRVARALNRLPAVINPSKWITFMDASVALSLWKYVKADVKKSTKLEGEALLEATAKRFNNVVENTQSMNDVLHRPEIQKRGDTLSRAFSLFKTDLYQSAGLLRVSLGKYVANKSPENAKAVLRTVASITRSAVWGSLMTTLFALIRYKVNPYRDDEDELSAESWLKRQSVMLMGDLIGFLMPIAGGEIVGFIENILFGETDELIDNLAVSAVNDLYKTLLTVADAVRDGEMPDAKEWENLFVKAATAFGVPASNIKRTVTAIKLHAEDIANGEFLSFEAGRTKSNTQKLYDAVLRNDTEDIEEARSLFKTESAINSALKKGLRDNDIRVKSAALALRGNDIKSFGAYVKAISSEGRFDSEIVEGAIRAEAEYLDNKLRAGAEALNGGESEDYRDIVRALRNEYRGVLTQDEIVEAILGYKIETEEAVDDYTKVESIYKSSDVNAALAAGDVETALAIVRELVSVNYENEIAKAKRKAEESGERFIEWRARKDAERAANTAVRKTVTEYWKPLYLEAFKKRDVSEMNRIRRLLYGIGIYGNLSELDKTLAAWKKS